MRRSQEGDQGGLARAAFPGKGRGCPLLGSCVSSSWVKRAVSPLTLPCSHRKLDVSLPTSALPVAAQPAEGEASTTTAPEGQDGALEVLQSMLTLPPQFAGGDFAAKWNASVAAAAGSAGVKQVGGW